MCSILSFKNISKSFGSVQALQSLSFDIAENKIIGLIGANGAGKTTAMRLIIRYLRPDSGNILFRQSPIQTLNNEAFPIAYVPDVPIYYEELSVLEHLSFISAMYNTETEKDFLIKRLELKEHLDKVPSILSKGNKQKLSIACALLRNYEILLADEPFNGLDPKQIKVLKDIILENKKNGKTIILSTHLLDMIESLCDEFIMIDHGKLLLQGTFEQIVSDNPMCASLEELYLHLSAHTESDDLDKEDE
jgi:ABC-2 type transport system ATP-binding protein